jgi:ectoine hydroxylase-related dioxygenase (phytanoyl-CoA dioxygenase family)
METLNENQVQFYRDNGYLMLESQIPETEIDKCIAEIEKFREEASHLSASNDRLDLEDSHTPDNPRLRRIKLPHTISDVFAKLMRSDHVLAPVRDLLGKDLRLHTSKLNMKSAEYGAAVEWHQDWAFYPHTNDDVLAVGIVLNDVGPDNGPLMVFPGTHKGEVFDHHSNGVFAGAMDLEKSGLDLNDAVKLTGPRGSMSIHHARTVHGSDLNRSDRDRMLLLYEIMAADAYPVMGAMTPWPSLAEYDEKLLCGSGTITPRLADVPVRIPQPQPAKTGSIYEIQSTAQKRAFDTVM